MTLPLYYYVLGTPLGVLGLIRWSFWLVRRIPAVLYRPVLEGDRRPISVVVPVYQEDPVVLAAAIDRYTTPSPSWSLHSGFGIFRLR